MKKRMIALALALTLAASTLLTGCGIVKVIKIGEEGNIPETSNLTPGTTLQPYGKNRLCRNSMKRLWT
ncbi:MAG: hypothetical protein ACLTLQ_11455 [[Clostridium] scindens]